MIDRLTVSWRCALATAAAPLILACSLSAARAEFDLSFQIMSGTPAFTPEEIVILEEALGRVERLWETLITGYQATIEVPTLSILIHPTTSGLAAASYSGVIHEDNFFVPTSGFMTINVNEIENFANWQGDQPNGLNFIDELIAHETGHVLGLGTLWTSNSVYEEGTFQYTGSFGLAAYQAEFDAAAAYVPVENAGNPGTPNAHWDQLMRSSAQEGNPSDPWSLDPRVGVTDAYGRDRGLELMTGAIDPDFLEPFIARFTVQSLRDMGYTVTEFEDANGDGVVDANDFAIWAANFGSTGMQIDGIAFGDSDRDRAVAGNDFLLWQRALSTSPGALPVPEVATPLIALAMLPFIRRISGRREVSAMR